jgi:3-oxoadipate enol-lactonase/4-carboxymuconolactone decarboxylase
LPFVNVDGTRHFYRLDGRDDRPTLIFSHSLGIDHAQWDRQAADLLPHFRVLRYDIRGHGATDAPSGDYNIERLAKDVLAIADAAGAEKFAYCGLSLGGIIGQWLGANAAARVTHLVLANTSARYANPQIMEDRRLAVAKGGMAAVVDQVMQRFFTASSLALNSPQVASVRRVLLTTNPAGYAGCCAAIRDMDNTPLLPKISAPTLVIFGEHDLSAPWSGMGEVLAASIPGAKAIGLPTAHISNIEAPRSFTAALLDFLLPAGGGDPLDAGFQRRREVLGDAHVDRSLANATDFNREFQQMITRYAWGTIWTRPHFDQRTRRILVLTTTATLGRWEEFRMHLRAGLAHELELCDVKELLLQLAVYGGVPAANTGFHVAMEELQNAGDKKSE